MTAIPPAQMICRRCGHTLNAHLCGACRTTCDCPEFVLPPDGGGLVWGRRP